MSDLTNISNASDEETVTISLAGNGSSYGLTNVIGDCSLSGTLTVADSLNSTPFIWSNEDNTTIFGKSEDGEPIYIVEKWQSRKPIDVGDGLYVSLKEDLISTKELQEKIYNKIEEEHPDKAIKLGLNKDGITLRKMSPTIELDLGDN